MRYGLAVDHFSDRRVGVNLSLLAPAWSCRYNIARRLERVPARRSFEASFDTRVLDIHDSTASDIVVPDHGSTAGPLSAHIACDCARTECTARCTAFLVRACIRWHATCCRSCFQAAILPARAEGVPMSVIKPEAAMVESPEETVVAMRRRRTMRLVAALLTIVCALGIGLGVSLLMYAQGPDTPVQPNPAP